jgi:hypothetical protein
MINVPNYGCMRWIRVEMNLIARIDLEKGMQMD